MEIQHLQQQLAEREGELEESRAAEDQLSQQNAALGRELEHLNDDHLAADAHIQDLTDQVSFDDALCCYHIAESICQPGAMMSSTPSVG